MTYLLQSGLSINGNNPQSKPATPTQVRNAGGGYSFPLSDQDRAARFLVCGSEGTYYSKMPALTLQNVAALERICFLGDEAGIALVDLIVAVSEGGRAPKQSPALFALAAVLAKGSSGAKRHAAEVVPRVARTGSAFLEFVAYADSMRGHGKTWKRALRAWYAAQTPEGLAYQATKYRERSGWTHRDVLRQLRMKFDGPMQEVVHWCVRGWPGIGDEPHPDSHLRQVWAFERAKLVAAGTDRSVRFENGDAGTIPEPLFADIKEREIVRLIEDFRLPREAIPTEFLNSARVWNALLRHMPVGAMIRNLGKMSQVGLLESSDARAHVTERVTDPDVLSRARIHPIALLSALKTYASGHGVRGSLRWTPQPAVIDALDAALYARMGSVAPTGKRILFAIDVSGSMHATSCSGLPHLAAHEAAACLALTYLKTEPNIEVLSFSAGPQGLFRPAISSRQRVDDAARAIRESGDGGTDCALPLIHSGVRKIERDAFVLLTDGESWAGPVHPHTALVRYRESVNPDARLVSMAVSATGTTIGDPDDRGTLGVVGFDASVPQLVASFLASGDLGQSSDLAVPGAEDAGEDGDAE